MRAGTEVRDLRPWLYRIAHNQALNTLRAAGAALPAVTEELPAVSLETEVERREELRETLHGIQALPQRQRAALVAVAVADRPHADVAAELGMSDGALRQLLLRARTTLRAAATALTPYPVVTWLAGGQEVTAARVAEAAVGAGGAGVAIKAGAAMLAAGAVVVGGPALRDEHAPARAKTGAESREAQRQAAPPRPVAAVAAAGSAPSTAHAVGDPSAAGPDDAGHANSGRKPSGEHSGHGGGGLGLERLGLERSRLRRVGLRRLRRVGGLERAGLRRVGVQRLRRVGFGRVGLQRLRHVGGLERIGVGRLVRHGLLRQGELGPQAVREGRAGGSAGARGTDRDRAGPGGHDRAPAVELGRGLGVVGLGVIRLGVIGFRLVGLGLVGLGLVGLGQRLTPVSRAGRLRARPRCPAPRDRASPR